MPKLWENCREVDGRKGDFHYTYPFTLARMISLSTQYYCQSPETLLISSRFYWVSNIFWKIGNSIGTTTELITYWLFTNLLPIKDFRPDFCVINFVQLLRVFQAINDPKPVITLREAYAYAMTIGHFFGWNTPTKVCPAIPNPLTTSAMNCLRSLPLSFLAVFIYRDFRFSVS
ncbi:MAG: hypothetical protein PT120_06580 [Aphanizomenon gracile PMC649.10]|jgi:hypothetical protein|nr:hypothetical protein [Aphanizomenon gracile PMC627.10]MDM3854572.1 hypothetical protein [Aphanizomenon gracile PMC649.10]MDM3862274.1 hypothetical protein [Aphanizomenon gracile PMC644.10]